MGLFGAAGRGGGNRRGGFDWGNAALAFFGGPPAMQAMAHRQRQEQERIEAEMQAQQRAAQMAALSRLVGPGGQPLFTPDQLAGMRSEDLSELAQAIYSPAQYGPGGGSQGIRSPRTGQTGYEQAPYRVEVGRTILQGGPGGGPPQPVYQGVEPVPVQPGGTIYGMRGDGTFVSPQGNPAVEDATPTVEDGYRYTPGPGGRANPQNWAPVAGGAGSQAPRPFDSSRLDRITAEGESGNRDFANGRPVTSPAGARFAMQVMPATARDPGFGVRPARNDSPEEYNRVGREYRAAMERRYGGDPALMWAAYNWGPGNLDNAIRRYGANWLQHAPPETRRYIQRNLRSLRGP